MPFFNFSASYYFSFHRLLLSNYLCVLRKFWKITKFLFLIDSDQASVDEIGRLGLVRPVGENLRWIAKCKNLIKKSMLNNLLIHHTHLKFIL